jgi:hypothetical protein
MTDNENYFDRTSLDVFSGESIVAVECIAILLCPREVPGSNLDPKIGYPDENFVGFRNPQGKC